MFTEVKMNGLLPASRYNSAGRISLLRELTSVYFTKDNEIAHHINIKSSDFIYDSDMYFNLSKREFKYKEWILRCFLMFCKDVSRVVSGESMIFNYENVEYLVPTIIVNSFLYHQQYIDIDNYDKIADDYNMNIMREIDLIPARKEAVGGQEKIMIDAILTIDAVRNKDGLKICVVGSSHDARVTPRSAYMSLFEMVTNSEFFFYDMLEEDGKEIINTNTVYRYRAPFLYEDLLQYDVFIDDAYIQGRTALESIMQTKVRIGRPVLSLYPDNYSIKLFADGVLGTYYHQIVNTKSGEKRLVSRTIIPYYKQRHRLGSCSFCRELKYFLKGDYNDKFYEYILWNHRDANKSCYPPDWYYKRYESVQTSYEAVLGVWELVGKRDFSFNEGVFSVKEGAGWNREVRRLVIDSFFSNSPVEMRKDHLKLVSVVISEDMLLVDILQEARAVYKFYDSKAYKLKKTDTGIAHMFSGDTVEYIANHLDERRTAKEQKKKREQDRNREIRLNSKMHYHVAGPMLDIVKNREKKAAKLKQDLIDLQNERLPVDSRYDG